VRRPFDHFFFWVKDEGGKRFRFPGGGGKGRTWPPQFNSKTLYIWRKIKELMLPLYSFSVLLGVRALVRQFVRPLCVFWNPDK
jgi:hypothetical protein